MSTRATRAVNAAVNEALKWDADARRFKIVRFGRHAGGYLHAQVQLGDDPPVYVHRLSGSWMIPRSPQSLEVAEMFGARMILQVLEPYSYLLADEARRYQEQEARAVAQAAAAALAAAQEAEEAANADQDGNQAAALV